MNELTERAIQAAVRYLEQHGYEILDVCKADEPVHIVARETTFENIVFVTTQVAYKYLPDDAELVEQLPACEEFASNWLLEHNMYECEFQFDGASFCTYGDSDKAVLRYHKAIQPNIAKRGTHGSYTERIRELEAELETEKAARKAQEKIISGMLKQITELQATLETA